METLGIQSGEVMDIGMRSSGVEGSKRTGAVLLGLIALFLLLSAFWGLQYASIVFAVLCAAALVSTKRRWSPALAAGSIIGAMVFIVFDYLMAIIWPEPFLLTWMSSLF
jgi:hypothetical protein